MSSNNTPKRKDYASSAEERAKKAKLVQCRVCKEKDLSEVFELQVNKDEGCGSCGHALCGKCLVTLHSTRGCGPLHCPICENRTRSGARRTVMSTQRVYTKKLGRVQWDEPVVITKKTLYEINKLKLDIPWVRDLNCNTTTILLQKYSVQLLDKVLAHWRKRRQESDSEMDVDTDSDEDDDDDETLYRRGVRPIMMDYGIGSGQDGAPSFAFYKQKDESPLKFANFNIYNGPMHTLMKFLQKAKGRVVAETHARNLISPWRKSDKAQDFILTPSDPTQSLQEFTQVNVALILGASRAAAAAVAPGTGEISPVDCVDFIISRARQEPLVLIILLDMRLMGILGMMRDSKRKGPRKDLKCNPDLYRSACRLSLLLFANTHSYKYIRILWETLIDWDCSSELDKEIYDALVFCQETVNGKMVWHDENVEWIMKDVRSWLGKHVQANMESVLTNLVLQLADLKKARTADVPTSAIVSETTSENAPQLKELAGTKAFVSTMVWQDTHNIWGPGPIKYSNGNESKGYKGNKFYDITGENELNWGILRFRPEGIDRNRRYGNEYYFVGERNQVTRPNKKVNLRSIPVLAKSIRKQKELDEIFFRSMDPEELSSDEYSKDDLLDQVRKENNLLPDDAKLPLPAKKLKKFIHAVCLVSIREKAGALKLDLSPAQTERVEHSKSAKLTEQEVETELQSDFYRLSATVRAKYTDAKFKVRIPGHTDGSDEDEASAARGSVDGSSAARSGAALGHLLGSQSQSTISK